MLLLSLPLTQIRELKNTKARTLFTVWEISALAEIRRDFYVYQPYEQVILKPVWWNQLGERYLGEYSAIKYRLIIEITGRTEFNTTEEIIEAAKTLRNYLAENPVYDENGQLITVPYLDRKKIDTIRQFRNLLVC